MYDSDKTTLVGKYYVNRGETLEQSNPDFEISLTGKKKDTFEGWVTAKGKKFSTSKTKVKKNLTVYAVYETRSAGTNNLSSGKNTSVPPISGSISTSGGLADADSNTDLNSNSADSATSAPTTQASASTEQPESDSASWGSRIALAIAGVLVLLGLILLALYLRRRKRDEAAPEPLSSARERIRF